MEVKTNVDLSQFAKSELTAEEQATLGTIQKAVQETLVETLKGVMTEEEITNRFQSITDLIDKAKKDEDEAKEEVNGKLEEATKIIERLREDLNELQTEVEAQKEEEKAKKKSDSVKESLKTMFESEQFAAFAQGRNKSTGVHNLDIKSLRQKGVVNVTEDYNGNVYPALRTNTFTSEVPLERPHLRDFMRTIDASDDEITSVYYRQMYDIDRAALAVSENGRLPEGSFKVREVSADTHRIGWHLYVSKRMLRKISLIQNRILTLMPSGMLRQEDFQILYGDNNDANFGGIVRQALTEARLNGKVYEATEAGKVLSIASYNGGASTLVTLDGAYAKMETGMKVVFSGFQTATAMNAAAGFEIKVLNDHTFVVDCAYSEETAESVKGNALFTIYNSFTGLVPDANVGDAIRAITSYLEFDIYRPSMIVINPMTMNTFIAQKDGNGRPMWNEYLQIRNGIYYFDGIIPIVTCDAIAKDYVLAGDFINAAELYDTQKGFVELAEDVETKLTNEVCAIIQEEVILAVTCPEAFMYAKINDVVDIINVASAPKRVALTSPLNADGSALMMEAKA